MLAPMFFSNLRRASAIEPLLTGSRLGDMMREAAAS